MWKDRTHPVDLEEDGLVGAFGLPELVRDPPPAFASFPLLLLVQSVFRRWLELDLVAIEARTPAERVRPTRRRRWDDEAPVCAIVCRGRSRKRVPLLPASGESRRGSGGRCGPTREPRSLSRLDDDGLLRWRVVAFCVEKLLGQALEACDARDAHAVLGRDGGPDCAAADYRVVVRLHEVCRK